VSYLLRVLLPDRPGMLGAIASALGEVGADILSVDVVERSAGVAVDDLIVELPAGKLADALVTAAVSVPGVSVESIQHYYAGVGEAHKELELLEALATTPDRAPELLVAGAPRIFRAGWAVVVRYDERGPLVEAASPAAPDLADVDLPWLPLARAQVLDPTARWVPPGWGVLGTELAAAPLGDPDRAVLVGRPGGPAWRPAELLRLAHLAGIAVTVTQQNAPTPR
jgi:ACT domain